jgi:DNA polymerase-3 subunit gamma/tau
MAAPEAQTQAEAIPTLNSFADVLNLIKLKRDIVLQLDVERYVRPISFRQGAIEYEPVPGAPNNLAQRLVARLKEWTGQPWLIAARGGGGAESAWERQKREALEVRAEIETDPFVVSVMQAFPGAEILSIRNIPLPDAAPDAEAPEDEDDE